MAVRDVSSHLLLTLWLAISLAVGVACGGSAQAARPTRTTADVTCQQGRPFVNGYTAIVARDDPGLDGARQQLNQAQSIDQAHAALKLVAEALQRFDADLAQLPVPAGERGSIRQVIAADTAMADQAASMSQASLADLQSMNAAFQARVQTRNDARRRLDLQVAFLKSECGV